MKWISGSVCAALVAASLTGVVVGAAGATAPPYDDCQKQRVNSTTDEVSCQFTGSGAHSITVPRIATDIHLRGVGGHGWNSGNTQVLTGSVGGGYGTSLAGQTLSITVGGNGSQGTGGSNGGGDAADSAAGGGGGATDVVVGGSTIFIAPGSGGVGDTGVNFDDVTHVVQGGAGGTVQSQAGTGETVTANSGDTYGGGQGGGNGSASDASFGVGGGGGAGGQFYPAATGPGGPGVPNGVGGTDGASTAEDSPVVVAGGTGGSGTVAGVDDACSGQSGGGGGGAGYGGGGGGGAGASTNGGFPNQCAGGGGGGSGGAYIPFDDSFDDTYLTGSQPSLTVSWTQELDFTSPDAPDGTVGTPYSFQFTSDTPGSTFRLVSGSTPPGLTLTSAGLLKGTPTTNASYAFTVEVTDPDRAAQRDTVQDVTIGQAPVKFTNAPPNATKGSPYSFRFTASNCPGCTFVRVAGQGGLPHGLALTSGGLLSGTPTTAESASFEVTATASDGRSATQRFAMKVLAAPALKVNDVSTTEASKKAVFTITLSTAAAGTVTVHYATADGTAHQPFDYTRTTGTLTFGPGQTSRTVTVPVVDDTLREGAETFTLNLSSPSGASIADGSGTATIAVSD